MKPMLQHTAKVTTLVHDELIAWCGGLLRDAGLEAVDVYGRFPPEGTVRSHLVLFPYRVGPEPKNLENSRGASLMIREAFPSDRVGGKVPKPWRALGIQLLDAARFMFPEAGQIDTPSRPNTLPYPRVEDLPKPLSEWYAQQDPEEDDPFVVEDEGELFCRPPALHWRPGVSIWAHYLAVAGDPGRGVSDRTSDAPPLSLGALACLTVGIQHSRVIRVELPPMPYDERLRGYLQATLAALNELELPEDSEEDAAEIERLRREMDATLKELDETGTYAFGIIPVHDLNMHEFALLTQALQRPLQAVLNFRLAFELGDVPEFRPSSVVSFRYARNKKNNA